MRLRGTVGYTLFITFQYVENFIFGNPLLPEVLDIETFTYCLSDQDKYVSIIHYTDCLRAGRSENRIPVGAGFSALVQTSSESQPFLGVRCGRGVTLTSHPLLVSRSKIE
jgi:hypothetical protein